MKEFTPEELIPTHKSLLSRLRDWEDQASWKSFFDTYWRLIYSVARQSGLTDAEAQDVVQETILSVAKQMPKFKYDPAIGSFKGWLRQITRRRIQDQFRKKQYAQGDQRRLKEQPLDTPLLEAQANPGTDPLERIWDEEWHSNLMQSALDRVKGKTKPAQYQMFYLHVWKKTPARQVAQRLDVKLAEVYYAKYTISRLLKRELKLLESQMI